jgi:hypothetical protein
VFALRYIHPENSASFSGDTSIQSTFSSIGIKPIVQNNGKPVDIRVVIVGDMIDESTSVQEKVGAFIDVTLLP